MQSTQLRMLALLAIVLLGLTAVLVLGEPPDPSAELDAEATAVVLPATDISKATGIVLQQSRGERQARIEMEKLDFDPEDALIAQLRAFVAAVRGRVEPVVPAAEALSALRTALRVVDAMPRLDDLT